MPRLLRYFRTPLAMVASLSLIAGLNTIADSIAKHPADMAPPTTVESVELPGLCNVPPEQDLSGTKSSPQPLAPAPALMAHEAPERSHAK